MNKVFGGTVHKKSVREDGVFNITLDNTCSLFRYMDALSEENSIGKGMELVWKLVTDWEEGCFSEDSEIASKLLQFLITCYSCVHE